MSVTDHRSGYKVLTRLRTPAVKLSQESLDRNHHEKFNYQGTNYLIHSPFELSSKLSSMHQSIVNSSLIINLKPRKTIIDEALRTYPPRRFDF
jgi:hypothetical protein